MLSEGTIDSVIQKLSFVAGQGANVGSIGTFVRLQDRIAEEWENLLVSHPGDLVAMLVKLLKDRLPNAPTDQPYEGFVEDYVRQRVRGDSHGRHR